MHKKIVLIALCFIALAAATLTSASADTGPKPSVVVIFKDLEQKNCFVTLLSSTPSTGPYSAYNTQPYDSRYKENDENYRIWEKFISYHDKDGFYFLQYFTQLDGSAEFAWRYHPPQEFKILMYFPEEDSFVASDEIYQQYAFDSYYSVDASALGAHPGLNGETIRAVKSYDYRQELISFAARTVLTIAVELAVALLFGYRSKRQLLIIGAANVVTQTLLNVLLNIINYKQGQLMFVLNYIWLELLVFIIEAVLFNRTLRKDGVKAPAKKPHPVAYAFTANLASFIAGLWIARLVPRLF